MPCPSFSVSSKTSPLVGEPSADLHSCRNGRLVRHDGLDLRWRIAALVLLNVTVGAYTEWQAEKVSLGLS